MAALEFVFGFFFPQVSFTSVSSGIQILGLSTEEIQKLKDNGQWIHLSYKFLHDQEEKGSLIVPQ